MKNVYLDHNATTDIHPEVKKTVIKTLENYGNPSSMHGLGRKAREAVEEARKKTASFIGAGEKEVFFTGSGSEANNTVLNIFSCGASGCDSRRNGRSGIITSVIEHPCILETSKCLEERGVPVKYLDVDKYGKVSKKQLEDMVDENTALVSIMTANNETGVVQDISPLAEVAHRAGAYFHTDAVQAVGKMPVDVKEMGVDFLTLSGHKIYAPKGVGALYVKKGTPFCPLIRGGHQEKGRRAGTENTPGIAALGKAFEMREKEMGAEASRLKKLKKMFKSEIKEKISDCSFNGDLPDSLPSTINLSIAGVEGEALMLYLDMEGISVSTGSACATGSLSPSHVLISMGLGAEMAHGSIRISMGRKTQQEDMEYLLHVLPRVVNRLREMSAVYFKETTHE